MFRRFEYGVVGGYIGVQAVPETMASISLLSRRVIDPTIGMTS
jgi:hypothetical protein